MGRWTGRMATAQLRTIQPTDYPTWRHVRRELARSAYDRQIVEEVTASIKTKGLQQPLCLAVGDDGGVYLSDGHHRAVALMNLRVRHFHFQWFRITGPRARIEHTPFPYDLLDR